MMSHISCPVLAVILPGATYVSMELANGDQIVRGLTGGRSGCP